MTPECPNCGSTRYASHKEIESFPFGMGPKQVQLTALVDVFHCDNCQFTGTDATAEVARHDAACRHLGLLTSSEISALRAKLGLTQEDLSELTGIGIASISRWENGENIQNLANDNLLALIAEGRSLEILRVRRAKRIAVQRGESTPMASHKVIDIRDRFPNLRDLPAANAQAAEFRLRICR